MANAEAYANWIVQNVDKKGTPEFETVAQAYQLAKSEQFTKPEQPAQAPAAPADRGTLTNLGMGALKGASDIGSTLLWPIDAAKDAITGNKGTSSHEQRKASLGQFFSENANPDSLAFRGAALGTNIAGTAGAGGVLAKGAQAIPALAKYAPALASGGLNIGNAATKSRALNALIRTGAGAATGAASTALIDPSQAGAGALIGGAIPGATKVAGAAGKKLAASVSPEVAGLYQKAKTMGIDIPADRLMNSRPMNALAASLNYLPFSGRAGTEAKMIAQLNRAASRTIGQDSPNISDAVRKAKATLGGKFDSVLKNNHVAVDPQLVSDLAATRSLVGSELVPEQARIISGQIDNIIAKAQNGIIDGQTAYNIKKTLDRIAKRNSPEAHYAGELRNKLVDALNRSLGSDEAANFAKVRQQYGNMKTLEKLAPNGAEGEITAGRLGALRNVRSQDLQDVADIAAQFVRTRENPHGAMQRIAMGAMGLGLGSAAGSIAAPVAAMGGGRAINSALNSDTLRNMLINPLSAQAAARGLIANPLARAIPTSIVAGQ